MMKKINVEKSTVFERNISSVKESFTHLKEEGYFSDFEEFSDYKEGVLKIITVGEGIGYPYTCKNDNGYKYFIPKSLAVFEEEEPKKYRPFENVYEFETQTGCKVLGESMMRLRSTIDNTIHTLIYTGYNELPNGVYEIHLGSYKFSLQELFEEYVLVRGDETFILGVEE